MIALTNDEPFPHLQNLDLPNVFLGILASFTVMCPYLGQFGGIPMRALAPMTLGIFAIVFFVQRHVLAGMRPRLAIFNAIVAFIVFLVIYSASNIQFRYLTFMGNWIHSPTEYYDAKLLMFLIGIVPVFLTMFMSSFLQERARENVVRGIAIGLVFIGVFAVCRLALDWQSLFSGDLEVAWRYLSKDPTNGRSFSLVGFGALLASSAVAVFQWLQSRYQRTILVAILNSIFLCGIFVVNQRSNFIFAAGTAFAILIGVSALSRSVKFPAIAAAIILIFVSAFVIFGANPAHKIYWGEIHSAFKTRVDMVARAFGYENFALEEKAETCGENSSGNQICVSQLPALDVPDSASSPSVSPPQQVDIAPPTGLGSFALVDTQLLFPHNILAELWMEVGHVSAILLAGIILWWAWLAITRTFKSRSPLAFASAGVGLVVLLHAMKAGDLGFFGTMVFALWLIWAIPTKELIET